MRDAGCDPEVGSVEAMLLTAAFLTIAARTKDETRVDHRDAIKSSAIDRVIEAVDELLERRLGELPSEIISGSVACELCDALEASTAGLLRHGVVAFATARCLDARLGRTFIDAFRIRSGSTVRGGAPIPVVAFPAEHLDKHERDAVLAALGPRTGDPRKRADAVDRTDHLRLAPAAFDQFRVRSIWADPWLDAVDLATRFGAGVTNHAALATDFRWDEYVVGTRSVFYGVAPRDVDAQRSRIEAALADARNRKATIVVLPELCLTQDLFDEFVQRGVFDDFSLVVAGSYHEIVAANMPGANVCAVFANGAHVFSHRKFSDFYMGARHEHLVREDGEAGFDLLLSPKCSVVVLICKDAFGETGDLVQNLAPTLLLIPAMSNETADFELLARRLAHDPQGFTLVACAGPKMNAIFGRPSLISPVITVRSASAGCEIFSLEGLATPGEMIVK